MPASPKLGLTFAFYVEIATVMTKVAGATGVNVDRTRNIVDTSNADNDGWATSVGGIKSWSAEVSGVALVDDATGDLDASQAALEAAFESDEPIAVEIRRPGETTGRTGLAWISNIGESNPHDNRSEFNVSVQGTGALVAA